MADKDKKPAPPPQKMGGMAGDAQTKTRVLPAYRDYQQQKMSDGHKPVTLEEYLAGKR